MKKLRTAIYAATPRWGYKEGMKFKVDPGLIEPPTVEEQVEMCDIFLENLPEFKLTRIYRDYDNFEVDGGMAWKRLMGDIECRKIDAIVIQSLCSIGGSQPSAKRNVERFILPAGVRILDVSFNFDSLTGNVNEYLHRYSQIYRSWETVNAHERFRGTDNVKRSRVPYGYVYKNESPYFFVDEKIAVVVKMIFELYVKGYSLRKISEWLIRENAVTKVERKRQLYGAKYTKHKEWYLGEIQDIIRNNAYIGTYENADAVFEGHHEAIVSKELFEQAQETAHTSKIAHTKSKKKIPDSVKIPDEAKEDLQEAREAI